MERRPEPRDYENNPTTGWTPQSIRLGIVFFAITVAGLALVYWISNA